MVNFCPTCGKEIKYPDAEICPSCGVRIRNPFISEETIYAGFWVRFVAYLIDGIVLCIPWIIILFIIGSLPQNSSLANNVSIISFLVIIIISWLYFSFQHSSSYRATLGKRAVNIVVVDEAFQQISFLNASLRWFIYSIPILNLVGFLLIALDDRKQGLHDKVAKTVVIYQKK